MPQMDQTAIADQVALLGTGATAQPPWNAIDPWQRSIPAMVCPSDTGKTPPNGAFRGKRNYVFCAGDSFAGSGDNPGSTTPVLVYTRGLFGAFVCYNFADCTDGLSNTIAMGESVAPTSSDGFGGVAGTNTITTPGACQALYNKATRVYPAGGFTADTTRGYRWGDGAAYFSAFTTATPPNSASCFTTSNGNHWYQGMWNASSPHVGGVHCLMGDGAVRFIGENIDCGNQAAALPAALSSAKSPYGVWGALGTRAANETASEF